jgi:hypothetical protein
MATKFSWASCKTTTRVEDMAYCLLGLVRVNMPMLYGEGEKAFYRLQLEVIKQTNEHTIFAWQPINEAWHSTSMLRHHQHNLQKPPICDRLCHQRKGSRRRTKSQRMASA